jgi:hypothetical protein
MCISRGLASRSAVGQQQLHTVALPALRVTGLRMVETSDLMRLGCALAVKSNRRSKVMFGRGFSVSGNSHRRHG